LVKKESQKNLVNDIECLLIALQQPEGNIQSKVAYFGRDLKIVNLGKMHPLPKRARARYSLNTSEMKGKIGFPDYRPFSERAAL
jgi:hypothetical protein